MLETKLIKVLKTFSEEELKKFEEYISSPYFNKSRGAVNLFKILEKYAPNFENKKLTKEKIYKKLYPERTYNDERIRNLISDLYKLCEGFMISESLRKDSFLTNKLLRTEFLNSKLYKFYLSNLKNSINETSNSVIWDENYFYRQQLLNEEACDYSIESIKEEAAGIQKFHDYSIGYFLLRILRIYILMLYSKNYTSDYNYQMPLLEEFISHLKTHSYRHIPIINIYYNILMLLKDESEIYYYILEKLLEEHYSELGPDDRYGMYFHLINYCIVKISADKKNEVFDRNLFELYKKIISRKNYKVHQSGYLDHTLFSNIVTHALRVKEFSWTENFINVYKDELPPEHVLNTYHICYASLFISKGELEKALELLRKIKTSDYITEMKIKFLMMKIYYELGYFDTIISLSDSFKHFLTENKLLNRRHKLIHMNFINFVGKLVRLKEGAKTIKLSDVKKDILSSKNLNGKEWLLEKVEEIEKN